MVATSFSFVSMEATATAQKALWRTYLNLFQVDICKETCLPLRASYWFAYCLLLFGIEGEIRDPVRTTIRDGRTDGQKSFEKTNKTHRF